LGHWRFVPQACFDTLNHLRAKGAKNRAGNCHDRPALSKGNSGGRFGVPGPDPAGDVALKIKLKGIEGCDGETLQGQATLRVTTNQCASLDADGCTVSDLAHFPVTSGGNCVIDKGQCQIKTTVNTEIGAGTLSAGHNTSIELGGIFLKRQTGANDPGDVATSGLVVP
jgi:hypothetical protein